MEYRLKRDLPFAKAGAGVYTQLIRGYAGQSELERTKVYLNAETFADQYGSVCLGMLSDLISTDWVEEIRPRGWYEIVGAIVSDFWGYRFHSYKEAAEYMDKKAYSVKTFSIIKVKEVIE